MDSHKVAHAVAFREPTVREKTSEEWKQLRDACKIVPNEWDHFC